MCVRSSRRPAPPGFTLIELLVVIAIITILISLVVAVGFRARLNARAASCASQMRQIGMALGMHSDRGISAEWTHSVGSWSTHKPLLLCPQGPQDGETNYALNERVVGRATAVSDTGATVLLYESKRAGEDLVGGQSDVDLRHSGATNFVFLDGHVERRKEIPSFAP